jgi:hypothetical protein
MMTLLMIRPVGFAYNPQTAVNNAFQQESTNHTMVQSQALEEFDQFVALLKAHDLDVFVVQDTPDPATPDSIFPNNWISFHEDGTVIFYPMFAPNRQLERKPTVLTALRSRFSWTREIDFSYYSAHQQYLEGTGSMVLDRVHKIAYACRSARTDEDLFYKFCETMDYNPVIFDAVDQEGNPIYHTNVLMCVADTYAVVTMSCIVEIDRDRVRRSLQETGHALLEINEHQMNQFAGNMLQVYNRENKPFLVMSRAAYDSLKESDRTFLSRFNPILSANLNTIEINGGGSARCMIAEIRLPMSDSISQTAHLNADLKP